MNETLKEMQAAVEAYNSGPQAARAIAPAVDLGLLTVILPYILALVIKDPQLLSRLTAFIPKLVAFVEDALKTFVTDWQTTLHSHETGHNPGLPHSVGGK